LLPLLSIQCMSRRDLSVKGGTSERCYRMMRGRTDEQRWGGGAYHGTVVYFVIFRCCFFPWYKGSLRDNSFNRNFLYMRLSFMLKSNVDTPIELDTIMCANWLIDWLLKVQQAIFQSYSGWEKFVDKKSERGDSGMGQHGQQ
jgi:hypothetical protein